MYVCTYVHAYVRTSLRSVLHEMTQIVDIPIALYCQPKYTSVMTVPHWINLECKLICACYFILCVY